MVNRNVVRSAASVSGRHECYSFQDPSYAGTSRAPLSTTESYPTLSFTTSRVFE